MLRAAPCELPASSRLRESLPQIDYLDSYTIGVARPDQSMIGLYAAALEHLPRVFKHLLVLRSILVRPFGIAGVSYRDLTSPIDSSRSYTIGDKVGRWTLYGQYPEMGNTPKSSSPAPMTSTSTSASRFCVKIARASCSPPP